MKEERLEIYEVIRESFGQLISMGLFLDREHAEAVANYWNEHTGRYAYGCSPAEVHARIVHKDLPNF